MKIIHPLSQALCRSLSQGLNEDSSILSRCLSFHVSKWMLLTVCLSLLSVAEAGFLVGKEDPARSVARPLERKDNFSASERGAQAVLRKAPLHKLEHVGRHSDEPLIESDPLEGGDIPVFGHSHEVLNNPSDALGSVILLTPLGGYPGFWREWLHKEDFKKLVEKRWRILEAMPGRKADYVHPMWYSYQDTEDGSGWFNEIPIESELTKAVDYVHSLIKQEHDLSIPYNKITILGYSQGATLALEAGFRFPSQLGLVFAERGIVLASRLDKSQRLSRTPYMFTAGADDNKYGAWRVKEGYSFLCERKVPSFYKEIEGLNHGGESKQEQTLALASIAIALEDPHPPSTTVLASLKAMPNWTASCTSAL